MCVIASILLAVEATSGYTPSGHVRCYMTVAEVSCASAFAKLGRTSGMAAGASRTEDGLVVSC